MRCRRETSREFATEHKMDEIDDSFTFNEENTRQRQMTFNEEWTRGTTEHMRRIENCR